MDVLKKYNEIFVETFGVEESQLDENFVSENIEAWDSLGHMNLISAMEEEFDIMMDGGDIMEFQSYEHGKEILRKYHVSL